MSLLFFTGFDAEEDTEMELYNHIFDGAPSNVRTGTRSFRIGGTGFAKKNLDSPVTELIVGLGIKVNQSDPAKDFLRIFTGATQQITLYMDEPNKAIKAFVGSSSQAPIGVADIPLLEPRNWNYFELRVKSGNLDGELEVRYNNVTIIDLVGIDTDLLGTNLGYDSIQFMNPPGEQYNWLDDIYICDTLGIDNNTFLGDVRVWPLFPNGNGTYSQLVGSDGNSIDNYLLVDEPNSPNNSDYVGSSVVGNKDTYQLTNFSGNQLAVYGIKLHSEAAKSDSGAISGRPVVRTNGVDWPGSDAILTTSFFSFIDFLPQNPVTEQPWTEAEINALEVGWEVRP